MMRWRSLALLGSVWCGVWVSDPARSQMVPDSTLSDPSRVTQTGRTTVITGGTQAGPNLFHSFRAFSIPARETASFRQLGPAITTVIARVTGRSPSDIQGTLEVLSSDPIHFFLINPNGVIFGPEASLNVNGSVLATTANSLTFADGSEFSARDPSSALLTISTPVGLQIGPSPGPIHNFSVAPLVSDPDFAGGLQVPLGQTLALIGGPVNLPGGVVTAEGGHIELGSVASGTIGLRATETGWQFDYRNAQAFQDIRFTDVAILDVSGDRAGRIHLQGREITITDESQLLSTTQDVSGGEITIQASALSLDQFSLISAVTDGEGEGGDVAIEVDRLALRDGSQVFLGATAGGSSGILTVRARDGIEADGGRLADGTFYPTGLLNQVDEAATGNGGDINLLTGRLVLTNGAQIGTTTFGAGNAGDLRVNVSDVLLVGSARTDEGDLLVLDGFPYPSGLFAGTERGSTGDGGALRLISDRLSLRDGAVLQTTTFGAGDAGALRVRSSEFVEVIGTSIGNQYTTSLFAVSGGLPRSGLPRVDSATGQGGNLSIQTGSFRIQDGAVVAVSSSNPTRSAAGAGTLRVEAQTLQLDNRAELVAETASGNGGNIDLVGEILVLQQQSQISSTAGVEGQGGNGGNMAIAADFIAAVSSEDSNIRADAFSGRGGNIRITTQGIFGLTVRDQQTPLSDITADSQLGVDGLITIDTPGVDPSQGTVELQSEPVDPQLAQGCQGGDATASRFVDIGRGGTPPNVDEASRLSLLWEDLRSPGQNGRDRSQLPTISSDHTIAPLVEAQGWQHNSQGELVLTSQVVAAVPEGDRVRSLGCQRLIARPERG